MQKLIKKIKKLEGVKTVEPMSDKVVVTFEPERTSIKVSNKEQLYFVWRRFHAWRCAAVNNFNRCVYAEMGGGWDMEKNAKNKSTIIPFTQYLKDYNLKSEWEKYLANEAIKLGYIKGCTIIDLIVGDKRTIRDYDIGSPEWEIDGENSFNLGVCTINKDGKWAEIIPNEVELVKGEIYYDTEYEVLFRHGCIGQLDMNTKEWFDCSWIVNDGDSSTPIDATIKQKKIRIKAEVKNGYFHELNKD
jgi:hypothetical protein